MEINPTHNISFKAAKLIIQRPPEGTPERQYVDNRLGDNLDKSNGTVQHLREGIDRLAKNAQVLPDGEFELRINKDVCLAEDSICGHKLGKALLAARRKIGLAPDYTKREGLAYELTYAPGPEVKKVLPCTKVHFEEKPDYHITDYMMDLPRHAESLTERYQARLARKQERENSVAQLGSIDNFLPTQGVQKGLVPEQTVIAMLQEDGMPKQQVQQICSSINQEIALDIADASNAGRLKALRESQNKRN